MKIENNLAIEASDFALIEKHYACPVSAVIRSFLEKCNGHFVDIDDWVEITYVTDEGKSISDGFTTINHTQDIIRQLQYIDTIEDFLEVSNWNESDVDWDKLLLLMSVNGGSVSLYIALCGNHQGKLFVVDNGDYGVSKVSLSLTELIQEIES